MTTMTVEKSSVPTSTTNTLAPSNKVTRVSFSTISSKLLVGASAGIFGTGLIYPFDVVKTKLQSNSQKLSAKTLPTFVRNILTGGGLYRGFSACLIGIAPEKAIKLAVNDVARDFFMSNRSSLNPGTIEVHEEIIAGSLAGCLQLIVTVPYEGVKIKLQTSTSQVKLSGWQVIQNMKTVKELYRGFTATLFRDVPFCVIFFPLYSKVKSWQMSSLYPDQNSSDLNSPQQQEPFQVGLIAGIVAGAVSAVFVTPADMLKTRIQQGFNGNLGFFEYASTVVKKEGYSALYKGWQARMLVIAPLYGIVSFAFEVQKRWMGM